MTTNTSAHSPITNTATSSASSTVTNTTTASSTPTTPVVNSTGSAPIQNYKAKLLEVAKRTLIELDNDLKLPSLSADINELKKLQTEDTKTYYQKYSCIANNTPAHFYKSASAKKSAPKMFAHIFADTEITGTALEGHNLAFTSAAFADYVEKTPEHIPEQIRKEYTAFLRTLATNHSALTLPKTLLDLPAGKSFGMKGGWYGTPGHAMVYEFVKLPNGNFDLFIYNTGDGVEYFHDGLCTGNKDKIRPFIHYHDVWPEELGLDPQNPGKSETGLFEHLINIDSPGKANQGKKDIYEKAFGHIQHKLQEVDQDITGFMTSQRGGRCSEKVLRAIMRRRLGSLEAYKLWEYHFKQDNLISFFNEYRHELVYDSSDSEMHRLLIEGASKKLLLFTAKLLRENLISEDLARITHATCSDLIDTIECAETNLIEQRKKESLDITFKRNIDEANGNLNPLVSDAHAGLYRVGKSNPQVFSREPRTFSPNDITAQNLYNILKPLETQIQNLVNEGSYSEAAYTIESLVSVLPLTQQFWNQVPVTYRSECLEALSLLNETYAKVVLKNRACLPEQQNTAMALFAFQIELARRIDPLLDTYGIDSKHFTNMVQSDPYLAFYNPSTFKRHVELRQYFLKLNDGKPDKDQLFSFNSYKHIYTESDVNLNSYPETRYLSNAIESLDKRGAGHRQNFEAHLKTYLSNNHGAQGLFGSNIHNPILKTAYLLAQPDTLTIGNAKKEYLTIRKAAVFSRLFCGQTQKIAEDNTRGPSPQFKSKLEVVSVFKRLDIEFYFGKEAEGFYHIPLHELHHIKNAKELDECVQSNKLHAFTHDANNTTSESSVLHGWQNKNNPLFAWRKTLICTSCEPALQPEKFIYDSSEHIPEVENSDSQTLFNLMLFRPTVDRDNVNEYLFEETSKNPHFIEQCNRYIERGLQFYYTRKGKKALNVAALLFFVRLSQRLKSINPNAKVYDFSDCLLINKWLKEEKDPQLLTLLHLHRICQHALTPPEKLTANAIGECITSWLYFCNENIDPQWAEQDLVKSARNFIFGSIPQIKNAFRSAELKNQTLNTALRSIGMNPGNNGDWEDFAFPVYQSKTEGITLSVNILNGKIAHEQLGLLTQGKSIEIQKYPNYLSLFGNESLQFKRIGEFHCLSDHPIYGEVRIKNETSETELAKHGGILQRKINGEWYQFYNARISKKEISTNHLPLPLIADHEHWVPLSCVDGRSSQTKLFIAEKQNPSFSYRVDQNGITHAQNASLATLSAKATDLHLNKVFLGFEATNCIVAEKNNDSIAKLRLPRFRSLKGNELSFSYLASQDPSDNEPKWTENPSYSLAFTQPTKLIGTIDRDSTLYLVDKQKKKYKVLIPMQPIHAPSAHTKNYDREISLLAEDQQKELMVRSPFRTTKISEYTSDPKKEQKATCTYLEYDLEDRTPVATTQEGTFYLAYLCLAQKKYREASDHLDSVPQGIRLTKKSLEILRWMAFEQKKPDPSPTAASIRLAAALRVAEYEKSFDQLFEQNGSKKELSDEESQKLRTKLAEQKAAVSSLYKTYRDGINTIDGRVRLNKDMLARLISAFQLSSHEENPIPCTSTKQFDPYHCHPKMKLHGTINFNNWHWDDDRKCEAISKSNIYLHETTNMPSIPKSQQHELERYFGYLYTVARTGDEKALLRLSVMLQFVEKGHDPWDTFLTFEAWKSLVHYAMRYQKQAPKLPNAFSDAKEKLAWFQNLIKLHNGAVTTETNLNNNDRLFKLKGNLHKKPISPVKTLEEIRTEIHQNNVVTSGRTMKFAAPKSRSPLNLQALCDKYFEPSKEPPPEDAPFKDPKLKVPESEKDFVDAIRAEFDDYKQREFPEGIKINKERASKILCLKSGADLKQLRIDISGLNGVLLPEEKNLEDLKCLIEELANTKKEDGTTLKQNLLEKGCFTARVDFEKLTSLFLFGNPKEYAEENPNLTEEERNTLHNLIGNYLIRATELAQVKRASAILKTIEEMDSQALKAGKSVNAEIRELHLANLAVELEAKMVYDPAVRPELLVHEYKANLRIRPKQYKFIEKLQEYKNQANKSPQAMRFYRSIIIQMLMGGGKTSVLATAHIMLSILEGKLTFFIPPGAQIETLRAILSYNLKNYFHMDLLSLQLPRDKMTHETLKVVLDQLENAPRKRQLILTKSDQIQSFQLELLSLLNLYKTDKREEIDKSILYLQEIENKIYTGTYLIDEVDLIMAPTLETNFPRDPGKKLTPEFVDLLRNIYEIHLKFMPELLENRQTEIDPETYAKDILPAVAKELGRENKDLQLPEDLVPSFVRYVTGEFEKDKRAKKPLSEQDLKLLDLIQKFGDDADKDEDNLLAAALIDMSKYFLTKIIPETIKKSCGQAYDRLSVRGKNGEMVEVSAEVIPFNGTGYPATTKFGNPWEAAAYQIQTAICKRASRIQIEKLANVLTTAAEHFMRRNKTEDFDKTREATEFFNLMDKKISLSEIFLPGKLDEAVNIINKDMKKVLQLEQELICEIVHYYPDHYSSNSQDLGAQMEGGSVASFSGTPWNWLTYPEYMLDNVELEVGTEGQIAEEMLRRQERLKKLGKSPLHTFNRATVKEILDSVRKDNDRFHRVRGIIDTAGSLKNIKGGNEQAARDVLEYYKDDDQIQYAFFYGCKTAEDKTPDHPMLMKKGHPPQIIHLLSTKKEDILAALGTTDEEEIYKIFYIYDEKHTEATDLPQAPWAINIISLSSAKRFLSRTFWQGSLRLRQYFKKQDLEFTIQENERSLLMDKGVDLNDNIHSFYANQAILKSKELLRAYGHRVRKVFRKHIMQSIRTAEKKASIMLQIYENYEKMLLTGQKETPFTKPGVLDSTVPVLEALFGKEWNATVLAKDISDQEADKIIQSLSKQNISATKISSQPGNSSSSVSSASRSYISVQSEQAKQALELLQQEGFLNKNLLLKDLSYVPLDIAKIGGLAGQIHAVFAARTASDEAMRSVEDSLKTLHANVKKDLSRLPALVVSSSVSDNLGEEMNIAMVAEVQKEMERELERDLEEELARYQIQGDMHSYDEDIWRSNGFDALPKKDDILRAHYSAGTSVYSLVDSFERIEGASWAYEHPYGQIFDDTISVTKNYLRSTSIPLPIFDRRHKEAQQILVLDQGDKLAAILVSIKEAALFKKFIEASPQKYKNRWIMLPDGSEYTNHEHAALNDEKKKQLAKILLQVNFYSGNANYLDLHEKETKEFFESKPDLKSRFLKLKVEKDPTQRRIFDLNPVMNTKYDPKNTAILCKERRAAIRAARQATKTLKPEHVASLDPEFFDFSTLTAGLVKYLLSEKQVAALQTQLQIDGLIESQVPLLSDVQFRLLTKKNLINATPNDKLHLLSKAQIENLQKAKVRKLPDDRIGDVSIAQVKKGYLSIRQYGLINEIQAEATPANKVPILAQKQPDKLKLLKNKDQIEKIPVQQFDRLTPAQVKHIPKDNVAALAKSRPDLIKHLQTEEQLAEVPLYRIDSIEPSQRIYLSGDLLEAYNIKNPLPPAPKNDLKFAAHSMLSRFNELREDLNDDFERFPDVEQTEILNKVSLAYNPHIDRELGKKKLFHRLDLYQDTINEVATKTHQVFATNINYLSTLNHLCLAREALQQDFEILPTHIQNHICEKISTQYSSIVNANEGKKLLVERLDLLEALVQGAHPLTS